jgi:hypothetical protein
MHAQHVPSADSITFLEICKRSTGNCCRRGKIVSKFGKSLSSFMAALPIRAGVPAFARAPDGLCRLALRGLWDNFAAQSLRNEFAV